MRRISRRERRADESRCGGVLKVCTLNVGSLIGRGREVVEMLARRKIDICCLQEVRYKNQGCTTIGSNDEKYKLWYSGGPEKLHGVGIMMRAELADNVIEVKRYDDRLMKIRMVVGKKDMEYLVIICSPSGQNNAREG